MLNMASIQDILNLTFSPAISNQLNNQMPTLRWLRKTIGSGKNMAWTVKLERGTSAGSYASGADITGSDTRLKKPAVLDWKRVKSEFSVAGDALAAAANAGPAAFMSLLGGDINEAVEDLGVELCSQVYGNGTGNQNLDLDGLAAFVGNTGVYAGISRVDYPIWQANILANGGVARDLSVELMRLMERMVFASGFAINKIVTTPSIYEKYEALFDVITRVDTNGVKDLGSKQLFFKGIPLERDPYCPAGTMWFLNVDTFELEQLPPVGTQDGIQLVQGYKPIMAEDGSVGLQVAIEMLGKSGDNYKGFIKVYGNIKGRHPNRNGVIKDISES